MIRSVSVRVSRAGVVVLRIVPTAAGRRILSSRRKLAVKVLITFAPTGGTASKRTRALTLQIKKKR